jgi:hypothetical protein
VGAKGVDPIRGKADAAFLKLALPGDTYKKFSFLFENFQLFFLWE